MEKGIWNLIQSNKKKNFKNSFEELEIVTLNNHLDRINFDLMYW